MLVIWLYRHAYHIHAHQNPPPYEALAMTQHCPLSWRSALSNYVCSMRVCTHQFWYSSVKIFLLKFMHIRAKRTSIVLLAYILIQLTCAWHIDMGIEWTHRPRLRDAFDAHIHIVFKFALLWISIRRAKMEKKRSHANDDWEHVFEMFECSSIGTINFR